MRAGMNTGIQDAHNLAWKISCLLKDAASPSIIQTYETERKPVIFLTVAFFYIPYKDFLLFQYSLPSLFHQFYFE